jgi:hypothetical protein
MNYEEDYYNGPAKKYFNAVLDKIIELGRLKEEKGIILDYGCGHKHLKERMCNKDNVVGYDIIPALSEVVDYKHLTPNKIVCSGVLEHLDREQLNKLLDDFEIMNPDHELIVFVPTENIISKIGMFILNKPDAHADHKLKYKEVNEELEKRYDVISREYIYFNMAEITAYRRKK